MAMHSIDLSVVAPNTDIMKLILEQIQKDYKIADNFMCDSLIHAEFQTSNEDEEYEIILIGEDGAETHVWIKNGVFKSAYDLRHLSLHRIYGIKSVDQLEDLRIYYVF